MRPKYRERICEEPRFAEALYRASIEASMRDRIMPEDPLAEGCAA